MINIDDNSTRCVRLARYMLENNATVRSAGAYFGLSKSTVHKDVTEKLKLQNKPLFDNIRVLLDENKAQRHLRGGEATRKKYKGEC
ncbi:MAG: sporulation transcriptional regulator SpoIIID [Clostridia bacterium]|nr:sporulation transcriptional regulator SpoIIID [Clostridia bacterium]